jgi:ATP-dependent helicase HrpB
MKDLARLDLQGALLNRLSRQQRQLLDKLAPTHVVVPSGSRLPIDYSAEVPVLAVRLQEMFGTIQTPSIAEGRLPLQLHLLTPAGRPAQITQDLAGFWRNGYAAVKKELKGRYPKHYWPDDPLSAQPTARVKPRKK